MIRHIHVELYQLQALGDNESVQSCRFIRWTNVPLCWVQYEVKTRHDEKIPVHPTQLCCEVKTSLKEQNLFL